MADNKISIKNKISQKLSSLSIDKDEMKKFCGILEERNSAAKDLEIQNFKQNQQTDEDFKKNKKTLEESFDLYISVVGSDGEELFGLMDDVFSSPNYPSDIKAVHIYSNTTLVALHNYYPRNSFEVHLDFSKPNIFDFSFMPSSKTPNNSNFIVEGYDTIWTNGVFSEISKFLEKLSTSFSFIHRHSVYDILLWIIGFPLAFWSCYKFSTIIEVSFSNISVFIKSAAYVYIFLATLFLFRILFHYLRWVFPMVEYKTKRNIIYIHRTILGLLTIALLGSFLYDLIKLIFII